MFAEPPSRQEFADAEQLKLLSIFHYVAAGMSAFFACFPLIHLGAGLFMVLAPEKLGSRHSAPPAALGWALVGFAALLILGGWLMAVLLFIAGRSIARRKRHTFCFVIACIECLFIPVGTALGVFTILVLIRPSVKRLFLPESAS